MKWKVAISLTIGGRDRAMDGEAQECARRRDHPGQDDRGRGQPRLDLAPSEVEGGVDAAKKGIESARRTNPLDVRQQQENLLKDLREACGEAMLELRARDKLQTLIEREDGKRSGRSMRAFRPTRAPPTIDPAFVEPINAQIEAEPSFGCRPVAWLPGLDKNTVRRIVRLKRRQVRKPPRRRAPAHRGRCRQ